MKFIRSYGAHPGWSLRLLFFSPLRGGIPTDSIRGLKAAVLKRRDKVTKKTCYKVGKASFFIGFFCLANLAGAETVTLKSGKKIEGKIVEKTAEYIKIDSGEGPLYFKFSYIAAIEQDGGVAVAPVKEEPYATDPNSYLKTGLKYAADGNFDEAGIIFQQGLKENPTDHNLREVLKMIEDLKSGKLNREYALCLFKGSDYLINAQYAQAAGEFANGLKINANDPDLYYYLGISYFSLERYREAIDCLKQALSVESGLDQLYLYLGLSYYSLGEYRQAIDYLRKNLEINPEDAEAYSVIGMSNFMLGETRQAEENLMKAKELFRGRGDYLNSADIEDFLGKLTKPM